MPQMISSFVGSMSKAFAILFILEALVKIIGNGFKYFTDKWNKFDFFLVLI